MLGLENVFTAGSVQEFVQQVVSILVVIGLLVLCNIVFRNRSGILRTKNTRTIVKETNRKSKGYKSPIENYAKYALGALIQEIKEAHQYRKESKKAVKEHELPNNKLGKRQGKVRDIFEQSTKASFDTNEDFMIAEVAEIDRQVHLDELTHDTTLSIKRLNILSDIRSECIEMDPKVMALDEKSAAEVQKHKENIIEKLKQYENIVKTIRKEVQAEVEPQQTLEKTQASDVYGLWLDIRKKRMSDKKLAARALAYAAFFVARFAATLGEDAQAMEQAIKLKNASGQLAALQVQYKPKYLTFRLMRRYLKKNSKHKIYETKFAHHTGPLTEYNQDFVHILKLLESIKEFVQVELKINQQFRVLRDENNKFQNYVEKTRPSIDTIREITFLGPQEVNQENINKVSDYTQHIDENTTKEGNAFIAELDKDEKIIENIQNLIKNSFNTAEGQKKTYKADPKTDSQRLAG